MSCEIYKVMMDGVKKKKTPIVMVNKPPSVDECDIPKLLEAQHGGKVVSIERISISKLPS